MSDGSFKRRVIVCALTFFAAIITYVLVVGTDPEIAKSALEGAFKGGETVLTHGVFGDE